MKMKSKKGLKFTKSPNLKKRVVWLIKQLNLVWLKPAAVYTYRSTGAKTRAFARIWGLSRIWQETLNLKPGYIIEAISERFDKLSQKEKDEVLLHELAHIPKNFSGALVPHTRRRKGSFRDTLRKFYENYRHPRRSCS